ncbi:butyrophilin subfamily 1 member A1-like isoform X2 [Pelmatolapia mariae]|uniref:butyrophilin subfamily 1 member A1-like isoform X2 n=1 Tax=Pelmatolapia mariae TaxID=158779 RepID=UPI002FE52842
MEFLPLLFMCFCFMTLSGLTFGDQSGKTVNANEGDDAILPCSLGTNENIEFVRFEWTKEGTEKKVYIHDTGLDHSPALPGRVSHFRDLQHGSASIRINKVQLEDEGNYTCNFPSRGKTFRIELLVVGAAEPEITIVVQRNGWALLQCDVKNAYPKPTVKWRDSNNETIHSEEPQVSKQGDRFNIVLKATVKKPDRYHCVATQREIKHEAQKEINVDFDVEYRGQLLCNGINHYTADSHLQCGSAAPINAKRLTYRHIL